MTRHLIFPGINHPLQAGHLYDDSVILGKYGILSSSVSKPQSISMRNVQESHWLAICLIGSKTLLPFHAKECSQYR